MFLKFPKLTPESRPQRLPSIIIIIIIINMNHHHQKTKKKNFFFFLKTYLILIVRMEHQRPHLNAFSRLPILSSRVHESRMRHPPSPSIRLRIKTFDQCDLIRSLAIQKVPLMLLIRPDSISLSYSTRVYELHRYQIAVRH